MGRFRIFIHTCSVVCGLICLNVKFLCVYVWLCATTNTYLIHPYDVSPTITRHTVRLYCTKESSGKRITSISTSRPATLCSEGTAGYIGTRCVCFKAYDCNSYSLSPSLPLLLQNEADILKKNGHSGRYDVRKCRCKVDPTDYKNLSITMTGKKVCGMVVCLCVYTFVSMYVCGYVSLCMSVCVQCLQYS